MGAPPLDAFFQPASDGGQRLYLHHSPPPGQNLRGCILFVHAWAEEMNKSRRMAALASRSLAQDGWSVLQVDLLGCGDSSGEFSEASWSAWVDDVVQAAQWLRARHPDQPLWLWGQRTGALLATAAAPAIGGELHFLLWQPVTHGKVALQQFLRLKAAAQLAEGSGKSVMDALRADLAAGRSVEVAGYTLPAALALGLEQTRFLPPPTPGAGGRRRVVWLEVTPQGTEVSPAARAGLEPWQRAGYEVHLSAVAGPAFWQTTEIEDAPALVQATLDALAGDAADPATSALRTEGLPS